LSHFYFSYQLPELHENAADGAMLRFFWIFGQPQSSLLRE
jgi:hypothetical protein